MGLDMYAYSCDRRMIGEGKVDFNTDDVGDDDREQIAYWRKHPDLHGWMEKLYRDKGGKDRDFNCVNVELTLEDLKKLERDVLASNLPRTKGFFFGESDSKPDKYDLEFIIRAKQELNKGRAVYYTSWW